MTRVTRPFELPTLRTLSSSGNSAEANRHTERAIVRFPSRLSVFRSGAARLLVPALLVLSNAPNIFGQTFEFGATAGIPLTQYFQTGRYFNYPDERTTYYVSATRRYTVGPAAEWHLTHSLSVELDAMYHRIGYADTTTGCSGLTGACIYSHTEVAGDSWDFPLMAKYRPFQRPARPFIAAGPVLRYLGPVHASGETTVTAPAFGASAPSTTTNTAIDTASPPELVTRTYMGATASIGVEFGSGHVRWQPEFRWTHWIGNVGNDEYQLNFPPDEVQLLLGVRFR